MKFILTALLSGLLLCGVAAAEITEVNVNSASAEELAAALSGVGLARAEAIVKYRESYGPFEDVYELINVSGIGERTVELNESRIKLK